MSETLIPTITRSGLAAVRNAQGTGLKATIAAIGVGTGLASGASFIGYVPTGAETALKAERARVPLLSGSEIGTLAGSDPLGFRVQAIVPALAAGTYPVCEVGIYLDDGTLFAVFSDPALVLTYMTAQVALELAFDLFLSQVPVAAMAITVQRPDIPDTTGILAKLLATSADLFIGQLKDEWRFPLTSRPGKSAA